MFNALRTDELLVGVGRVLRLAADADGPLVDYDRGQLLSALSVTRLLASEQRAAPALLANLRADLGEALATDPRDAVVEARAAAHAALTGVELGDVLVALLQALPREDDTRTAVHHALRRMIDDEVSALAQGHETR